MVHFISYSTLTFFCRLNVPTQRRLDTLFKDKSFVSCNDDVTDQHVVQALAQQEDATFITFSIAATNWINHVVVQQMFFNQTPLRVASLCDDHAKEAPIYHGMRVMITENRNKTLGAVNGVCGSITSVARNTIFVSTTNDQQVIPVHPVHDEKNQVHYTLRLAYSNTIAKVQGQTLSNIIVWLDSNFVPPGCAYVALSRVRSFDNNSFLQSPCSGQFIPNCR